MDRLPHLGLNSWSCLAGMSVRHSCSLERNVFNPYFKNTCSSCQYLTKSSIQAILYITPMSRMVIKSETPLMSASKYIFVYPYK